jgi:hypothetical protein
MRIAKLLLIALLGLLGCSCSFPHPLQDDVTGLHLAEIIRKITCEARDALDSLLTDRGVSLRRQGYKDANNDLKALTKRVLSPYESESKQLAKRKLELDAAFAGNIGEIDAILGIYRLRGANFSDAALEARLNTLYAVQERTRRDVATYIRALQKHNKDLALAQKIVDDAKADVKRRTKDLAPYYAHEMAYSFRFRIVETNVAGLVPPATFLFPIHLGTATIGVGATDTKQRDGERLAKLVISFEDLHGTPCTDAPEDDQGIRARHYPVRGKIGVYEVIAQYFALLDRAKSDQKAESPKSDNNSDDDEQAKVRKIFAKTDSYTDTIIFDTTITGSVTPSIILRPTKDQLVTGSLGITGTRKDTHTVTISLSAPTGGGDDDSNKITRVQLIKDDALAPR